METRPSAAVLLHLADWELGSQEHSLANNVKIVHFADSGVQPLYERLCAETGIDDGEPLDYGAYLLLQPSDTDPYVLDAGDPFSLADRLVNLFAIYSSHPITWSRVIWSRDGFQTADGTQAIHQGGTQTSFIESNTNLVIDTEFITAIECMWSVIDPIWKAELSRGRLANALTYFYYGWRAHYVEQMCLNFAIALEILFAPHSQAEATHQLCFNLSRFAGSDAQEREALYSLMKRFYALRSAIVHGGIPDDGRIIPVVGEVFRLTSKILRTILSSVELASTFNSDVGRRRLWNKYLFT